MTFRGGTHDLWLRYWLAAGGINPDTDVSTIVIPPPQMVANMKAGTQDAFCVGEPWNGQLVNQKVGYTACLTIEIWMNHPEKALGMRADWVDNYPRAAQALTAAVMEAQQWCDQMKNRPAMCSIVSGRQYINVPIGDILPRLQGTVDYGDGRDAQEFAALHEVLGRQRLLPLQVARPVVPHREHPLGHAARRQRTGPGRTRSTAPTSGARPPRHWRQPAPASRQPRARRTSSTARCSTRPIRPPTSRPADQETRVRGISDAMIAVTAMAPTTRRTQPSQSTAPRRRAAVAGAAAPAARRSDLLAPPGGNAAASRSLPPLSPWPCCWLFWQMAPSGHGGGLPAPTTIWMESKELILDPFFDRGGVDKGLFWHVLTSLKRVAIGFSLAALVGIALGVLVGSSNWAHRGPRSDLPGAAHGAAAGLAADLAGGVPPGQSIGAVRDLHHLDLADHHQHRRRRAQHPAGLSSMSAGCCGCRRWSISSRILLPATTPYIFTGLRIGVGMSWLAIVASEMLLGGVGVGFFIWDQYNSSRISDIVVALVWVGLVGFALDRLVALLGRLVSRGSAAS